MLSIVRSLPYFKGVTRNTAMKIAGLFEKHKPCMNQVIIKQGDKIDEDVIIIIHKGEFRVTKKVQSEKIANPSAPTPLVVHKMVE